MDAHYAFYALHKFNMLPNEYINLERREKAFVIAAIQVQQESDAEQVKKMKKK